MQPLVDPLPRGYGTDQLEVFARDPYWLFCYWEVTDDTWQRAREILGDVHDSSQLVIRVDVFSDPETERREAQFDVDISGDARSWYIEAGRPRRSFELELGLRTPEGLFLGLVRSRRVTTPPDQVSNVLDEEWRSTPELWTRLYSLAGAERRGDSLELRRPPHQWISSEAVSSFGASEERPARHHGFWFVLGTELLVHGSTEPDARVTCQGRPVELRSDGTFTVRFALPDGTQIIPCMAESADGSQAITITPAVEKETTRSERRGNHIRHWDARSTHPSTHGRGPSEHEPDA